MEWEVFCTFDSGRVAGIRRGTAMYLQHAEAPTKLIAQLAVGSDALPHCLKLDPCNSAKRIAGPETDWQAGTWGLSKQLAPEDLASSTKAVR